MAKRLASGFNMKAHEAAFLVRDEKSSGFVRNAMVVVAHRGKNHHGKQFIVRIEEHGEYRASVVYSTDADRMKTGEQRPRILPLHLARL